MPPETLEQPARLAVAFGRVLRNLGVEVPVGSVTTFARALAATGLVEESHVYWAGRTSLLSRPEDGPAFDAAFGAFWRGEQLPAELSTDAAAAREFFDGPDHSGARSGHPVPQSSLLVRYSPTELLRHRDFAESSPEELAQTYELIRRLRVRPPSRRSGRRVAARRGGSRLDLRRTLRSSMRTGGETLHRPMTKDGTRPRRIVLLCDVSGSMDPYSRALLRFVQAATSARRTVEAFALGTRLTRITRELSWRDPDEALARAASAVRDRSGGTRLGECLTEFNQRWGAAGMARGAVVVVMSDGWDRGDPGQLGAAMGRLRRLASRVVWVNPLKATPGYAPLARGMAVALPFVDDFVEGNSLGSLESLAEVIAG